jgi:hypothetical protein
MAPLLQGFAATSNVYKKMLKYWVLSGRKAVLAESKMVSL